MLLAQVAQQGAQVAEVVAQMAINGGPLVGAKLGGGQAKVAHGNGQAGKVGESFKKLGLAGAKGPRLRAS